MLKRYRSGSNFSYSFRKRRSRVARGVAYACFGLLLFSIIVAGLWLGSLSQNRNSSGTLLPRAVNPKGAPSVSGSGSTAEAVPTPIPTIPISSISPVALVSQKWNWPLNYYSPEAFKKGWLYNDNPVQNQKVNRGLAFGAAPVGTFLEQYKESPQGLRLVQYWDKTRLEINDPSKTANAPDYTGEGMIVKELLSASIQVGDKLFMPVGPARVPLAGDPSDTGNPALTYSTLASLASLKNNNRADKQTEATVATSVDKQGRPYKDPSLAVFEIKNSYYSQDYGHNIPNVFWEFLNRSGTVFENGVYQNGKLYPNWQQMAGLPLTEAYWTKTTANGKQVDVLVQAFERRILLFTPSNQPGLQVDWGNAGLHYLLWRYSSTDLTPGGNKTSPGNGGAGTPRAKTPAPAGTAGSLNPLVPELADTLEIKLVLGNDALARTFSIQNGRVTGSTLVNRLTGKIYSNTDGMGVAGGFFLKLENSKGVGEQLNGDQFSITGYTTPVWTDLEKQLTLKAVALFQGQILNLKFNWRLFSGRNYLEKWVSIDPTPALADWKIRFATVEDLPLAEDLKPASPTPDEDNLPILIPSQRNPRVAGGAIFTHLMVNGNQPEGLFFFSATPLGGEYALDKRVVIFQEEYQELKDGFTSGKAIMGAYTGNVDIGFKRYVEYLQSYYSQMAGKRQAVWYHSWYPFTNEITQDLLLNQLELMKQLGIYDILHVDAGWESIYPLEIDTKKFPQGFKTLMDKAAEGNIRLGLWINPFSNSYEQYVSYAGLHRDHPEWHIKGLDHFDDKKGYSVGPFSINSGYFDYVHDRLLKLVKDFNIRVIYWDGADWNIPDANAPGLTDDQRNAARVKGLKRLNSLMDDLHKVMPDIQVVAWNSTADVHLLGAVEQLQLSDVWELPLGESELFRLKQFYSSTYQLPYYSIWGDWYSITYKENKDTNLNFSNDLLNYVETEMVGAGGNIAGASLDLSKIKPELRQHLKKLYTWRRKFEQYFSVYQHILEEPDRDNNEIIGEGHIINGSGFLLLNNPTGKNLEVNLPLSSPELELDSTRRYALSDWSNLEIGQPLGEAYPGEGVPISVPAHTIRIIGVNISGPTPAAGQ